MTVFLTEITTELIVQYFVITSSPDCSNQYCILLISVCSNHFLRCI